MSKRQLAEWVLRAVIGSLISIASMDAAAAAAPRDTFQVHFLTSNGTQPGTKENINLVNGWGLAASPAGPWWVASNAMNLALAIDGDGAAEELTVEIPGAPTGIAFNPGPGFMVREGVSEGPARFLFATEDGTIAGWNPDVPAPGISSHAFIVVDNAPGGAVYKGLTIAATDNGDRLYAADFRNNRIDVYDGRFNPVVETGAFEDPRLPEGFAPFNVETLNGRIFVAYAKRDPTTNDEVKGQGLGVVDVYDTEGRFVSRVPSRGLLDAPWGLAIAPPGFGNLGGRLLVGNFGDGKIQTFRMNEDMRLFTPSGEMRDENRKPVAIDGLWGIAFGNGHLAGSPNALFFAAGPHDEEFGLLGNITQAP